MALRHTEERRVASSCNNVHGRPGLALSKGPISRNQCDLNHRPTLWKQPPGGNLMLTSVQHPVFGRLIPDQWGSSLLMFRQFPFLRLFWPPDPERQMSSLDVKER